VIEEDFGEGRYVRKWVTLSEYNTKHSNTCNHHVTDMKKLKVLHRETTTSDIKYIGLVSQERHVHLKTWNIMSNITSLWKFKGL
jgi:hypothetical protein